ncbi:MAG TPA: phosphodiester glycosidase family protein [Casimicrobiaceae bacterium]|nr:phosphodiester glycosidase family protein [Casimicrobiaceae bacterium]
MFASSSLKGPTLLLLWLGALFALSPSSWCADLIQLQAGEVSFVACEVDLRKDRLAMFWKSGNGEIYGSFAALEALLHEQGTKLVCGTNGGIFDESQKPLGLYIENGRLLRRINLRRGAYGNFYLQPNGVFALKDERAEIVTTDEYEAKPVAEKQRIRFAIQSGPVLLRNGEMNPLFIAGSTNLTTRNAVCVRDPTDVALVAAQDPVNFYYFALALRDRFRCQSALYLDGSLSTFYPSKRLPQSRPLAVLFAVTAP